MNPAIPNIYQHDIQTAAEPGRAHPVDLFYRPTTTSMWDTWVYHHEGKFHLYHLSGPMFRWDGIAMAISQDGIRWEELGKVIESAPGVTWLGSGSVWTVDDKNTGQKKFMTNFSEWTGHYPLTWSDTEPAGRQAIFFAESQDLIHWERLGSAHEFHQDARWYEPNGRWDNLWPVPRPEGGFYGYWAANPKDGTGMGFGESPDGVTWQALPPPIIPDAPWSPEIGAIRTWRGKYYAMVSMGELNELAIWSHVYMGTVISDSPHGPFRPAEKNSRLLVSNASYFCRFIETPDGVLVNHHSWELAPNRPLQVAEEGTYMAPLKRAIWDEEGTLRLAWWSGNDRAKDEALRINAIKLSAGTHPALFHHKGTLILEGTLTLPDTVDDPSVGLLFPNLDNTATAFFLRPHGIVEYCLVDSQRTILQQEGLSDRELALRDTVRFRLVRKGRLTEFYLDDFLMLCYCLADKHNGRTDILGPPESIGGLCAWHL